MDKTLEKPQQIDHQDLHTQQNQNLTCEICIEPILSPNKRFKNKELCSHPFCEECIIMYIQVKLEDNVAEIPCPGLHCNHVLDTLSCRTILPPQQFVKWCDVLCNSFVLGVDNCYCPYRDCSVMVINECGERRNLKKTKCPNCKKLFCFKCKIPWHAGFKCDESKKVMEPYDVAFRVLAEQNKWMSCPRCHHLVQRVDGCMIITCRCRAKFCYKCGRMVRNSSCDCDEPSYLFFCISVICFIGMYSLLFLAGYMLERNH